MAEKYKVPFYDGDDFHPEENIAKMASGIPLNDYDRRGWLMRLNELLHSNSEKGAVVACSALKETYRSQLAQGPGNIQFVFLDGSFDQVKSRLKQRQGHFMPLDLLKSQFDTLERPKNAIKVTIMNTPDKIVQEIINKLG